MSKQPTPNYRFSDVQGYREARRQGSPAVADINSVEIEFAFNAGREQHPELQDTRKYRYPTWDDLEDAIDAAMQDDLLAARMIWLAARETGNVCGADGQPVYRYGDWDVFSATLFSNQVRQVPLIMRLVWNDARAVIP